MTTSARSVPSNGENGLSKGAADIICHPGGHLTFSIEIEPPNRLTSLPSGYTFYAEFIGPIAISGAPETVIETDDGASNVVHGKTVTLVGTVPPTAPLGRYKLSHLEQRFHVGPKTVRNVVPVDSIVNAAELVAELVVEAVPAQPPVSWPTITA